MGLPAKVRRPVTDEEREGIATYASNYFDYKESYLAELKRS
jgi:carbonic anhydrase/acetyltransferase-like protein (isoleucine patch superfamily)